LNVLPPQVAAERYGSDALFIVTIWNPQHWHTETRRQLWDLGCRQVVPPSVVYWRFSDTFLPFYAQGLPHTVYEDSAAVLKAAAVWSDDRSREEYLRQIRWRTDGEWEFSRPLGEESYFPDGVFSLVADEVFVDCGAFDGDTIRALLLRRHDDFRRILAVEPDSISFAKLQSYLAGLPPEVSRKITPLYCAVGAERRLVHFENTGEVDSHSSENHGGLISCVPISELLSESDPVTYIKMDIEGAELDALLGARRCIESYRPVLAICVYHKQHDVWRLPLLMKDMVPEYRLFLRCHEGDGWQTVAYAVPPGRVKQ